MSTREIREGASDCLEGVYRSSTKEVNFEPVTVRGVELLRVGKGVGLQVSGTKIRWRGGGQACSGDLEVPARWRCGSTKRGDSCAHASPQAQGCFQEAGQGCVRGFGRIFT